MFVYVLDKNGKPLMPTSKCGKVRHLLKDGRAKVVKRTPFTIKLLYDTTTYVEELTLGVDAGSGKVGISVTSEKQEYFSAEVELRTDIVDLLSTRNESRRGRRHRKTRYRQPRFLNRVSRKKKGWLAPSIEHKIQSHLTMMNKVMEILPIRNIEVEVASFDLQKLKNPNIQGEEYKEGEQLGFWNVREYVLFRDGHTCQCCKGKNQSGDTEEIKAKRKILNVHHIESRKTGGDAPDNLITLCEHCHKEYHKGNLPNFNPARGESTKDAAFMGIMRKTLLARAREMFSPKGIKVSPTYGYITKDERIKNNLPKEHYIDARCITKNANAKPCGYVYYYKKVRCHNRQLHKSIPKKGNKRQRTQSSYEIHGFRLYDKVLYEGKEYFIFGKRTSGYFDIRTLERNEKGAMTKVNNGSVSNKKLKLLEIRKSYIVERKKQGN